MRDADGPPDWTSIQWHDDPKGVVYASRVKAERAARWLNNHWHPWAAYGYRVGLVGGRWVLQRRWVGLPDDPLVPPEAEVH